MSAKEKFSVYGMVTERILAELDKGTVPWQKNWIGGGLPKNFISKKPYRGINLMLLSCAVDEFNSPYWMTFKQIKDKKGHLKKGSKSWPVVFWNFTEHNVKNQNGFPEITDSGEEKMKKVAFLKYYNVFNMDCVEGIEIPEMIIENMPNKPEIFIQGGQPFYSPIKDNVVIPDKSKFRTIESYYKSFFHELVHSTSHEKRVGRAVGTMYYDDKHTYCTEEMIAEMGAVMLLAECGLFVDELVENSAAYIDGWRKNISEDPKLVVQAASKAQKAVDYILGIKFVG